MLEQQTNGMKVLRDRALLLIGFAGAFRRSELVGMRVEHITRLQTGIEVELPCSKTDQQAESRQVHIPTASSERNCPVRALEIFLSAVGIADGPAFRSVDRHGNVGDKLSAHAVALIVKESVGRAGGNMAATSAHSLKAGYVSTAVDTLLPHQIMEVTGHRSMTTLSKYIRPVMRRKIPSLL
jgi:integrase